MIKIEAITLEDAYTKASQELNCSITELNFEVIQQPKSGLFGLWKKTAIIVATCKPIQECEPTKEEKKPQKRQKEYNNFQKSKVHR